VILLCGIPSERPIALVRDQLEDLGAEYAVFDQRRFAAMDMHFTVRAGCVTGSLRIGPTSYPLEEMTGVYTRVMDDQHLPELAGQPDDSTPRRTSRRLNETLTLWCEVAPGRVVNRSGPMASNASKPFQAQFIRAHGFMVPETLVTNDPAEALSFVREHGRVIYKSVSGVRSVVTLFDEAAAARVADIRWCPVQFQSFVDGLNVRVHVVGEEVIATGIVTDTIDYRYASRAGAAPPLLEPFTLPPAERDRCVALSRALGLDVAGIDLKRAPDGQWYCFEVNPSPAFSYYEDQTGQPISRTIARYLVG
jgi:glutathione synthase/RimK-type ligase-like ATP-grasp enzyme